MHLNRVIFDFEITSNWISTYFWKFDNLFKQDLLSTNDEMQTLTVSPPTAHAVAIFEVHAPI